MQPYSHLLKLADSNDICAFSSRLSGNMSLSYADTKDSLANRRNFLDGFGIDYRDLVCAKQIHASSITYVTDKDRGRGALSYETSIADTDAFVTDKKNLPLVVFTADCLSIFLYDSLTPAIGLIHAGWRSTKENITTKAVQAMQKYFNTKTVSLRAGFGPAIGACCYEVSADFNEILPCGLVKRDNRYYLDLVQINRIQLLDSGVREGNILDSNICTSCRNTEFFSYRKEGGSCARIMSVTMLKD